MTTTTAGQLNYPDQFDQIKKYIGTLRNDLPELMSGFAQLHKAASATGALDTKTKELMALAISVVLRCDGCIAFHMNDAIQAGASNEEIKEALGVAVLMGGGPSVVFATHAIEALDQYQSCSQ